MYSHLTGKAILKNLDSYIHFEGEMDQLCHNYWSGKACYPVGNGVVLNSQFESDESHLERLIREYYQCISSNR